MYKANSLCQWSWQPNKAFGPFNVRINGYSARKKLNTSVTKEKPGQENKGKDSIHSPQFSRYYVHSLD